MEDDRQFRIRLYYVTGSVALARLGGGELDQFADEFRLKRRTAHVEEYNLKRQVAP